MRVSEVLPATGVSHDPTTDEGRAWLASVYARSEPAYVRLNMITTVTGAAAGTDGTSETLSSRVDRQILGVIRAAADVVVVGAATVRAEGYLLPRAARLAVVTVTGDLSGHRFDDGGASLLLVCPADRADEVRARAALPAAQIVPVPGGDDLEPAEIIAQLAALGLRRLVCEGGPTLAGRFASAGVIDEYCVTVAPVLEPAARSFLPLPAGASPHTEPAGMLVDDAAFSYLRLRSRS
ncbi:dihydrofolate reductase family protein [Microbacterium sp. P06]|uniref:dihydrofolate reductase family protein n=1 Tax=unclassified Microbacterium TaxID=2609290 RepID=UPI003746211B